MTDFDTIYDLIETMVFCIVDDTESVDIREEKTTTMVMYEITVGKEDVGKLIGKDGRVASSLRTIARSAGAKLKLKVLVNVMNKPLA